MTRFTLDATGRRIVAATPLERAHPLHDAATTGALVGGAFYYIANAQLRRLQGDGTIAADPAAIPSAVLRLPLEPRC